MLEASVKDVVFCTKTNFPSAFRQTSLDHFPLPVSRFSTVTKSGKICKKHFKNPDYFWVNLTEY